MPDLRRLPRYLAQRRADPAIAVAVGVACLLELVGKSGVRNWPLAVVEVIILCAPLVMLRTRPVAATYAEAAAVLIAGSFDGFPDFAGDLVVCALAYCCGAHASPRKGGFAVGVLIVAMQVSMGFSEFPNVEIGFATLGPFWVGYQVRLRSALVTRLAERTRELHDEQDTFARLSVRRERLRIARELHDIVAHHLAVIVVQAGAGRMAAHGPSQRARERFRTIRQSGGQALAEMEQLVDILRAEDARGHGATGRWRLLVDEAQAGGVEVRVTLVPPDVQLPSDVEDNAYRIVREGLTNAMKHAPGAQVRVQLALHEHDLEIEVHDDGSRNEGRLVDTGSGLGLIGMRERAESSGGTLEAGPDPDGGWRLCAVLPVASPSLIPTR